MPCELDFTPDAPAKRNGAEENENDVNGPCAKIIPYPHIRFRDHFTAQKVFFGNGTENKAENDGSAREVHFGKNEHDQAKRIHDEHVFIAVLNAIRTEDREDCHRAEHDVVGRVGNQVGIPGSQNPENNHKYLGQQHAADKCISDAGMGREQLRSGEETVDQEAAEKDRRRRATRYAQG